MKINTIYLLLCLFATAALCAQTGPDMTGPPGECSAGQNDDRTHADSEYFPITASFAPSTFKSPQATSTLLFMSFNIQSDYDLYCAEALSNQTALIAQIKPDFVGLQETDIDVDIRCNCNQPQALANAIGYTAYFMLMFPWRSGKYGDSTAVGYSVDQLTYKYYNVVGAWPGSEKFERRGALGHLVSPPQLNGQKMWYINTHLEQSSLDVRKIQVAQLIDWVQNDLLVAQPNAVVVITGDFYTVPGDGSYEAMNAYFQNTWAVFSGSSNGGFTHPSDAPTLRYDHIWYREPAAGNIKVTVKDFTIVKSLLSDHLPIHATLSFDTSGSSGASTTAPTAAPSTAAPSTAAPSTVAPGTPTDAPTSAPATAAPATAAPATAAPVTSAPTTMPSGSGSSDNDTNANYYIMYTGYTENTCTSVNNAVTGEIFAHTCVAEYRLSPGSGKIIYVDENYLISCDYSDTDCVVQTVCATYNNSQCYGSDTVDFSNSYSWTKLADGTFDITYSSFNDKTCTVRNDDLVGQLTLGQCAFEYHTKAQSGQITYINAEYLTSCDYSDAACQVPIICVNYTNDHCNSYTGVTTFSDKYSWALQKSSSSALFASAFLVFAAVAVALF